MTVNHDAVATMLDESAIRRATARFADAAMRGDYGAFRKVWAEDAHWTIGDPPRVDVTGQNEIVDMLRQLRSGREFFVQFALQGPIDIEGDSAVTTCICHESAMGPGDNYYRNHCVAFDRLARAGEDWVFTSRAFRYLWLDTTPFSGGSVPLFDSAGAVVTGAN